MICPQKKGMASVRRPTPCLALSGGYWKLPTVSAVAVAAIATAVPATVATAEAATVSTTVPAAVSATVAVAAVAAAVPTTVSISAVTNHVNVAVGGSDVIESNSRILGSGRGKQGSGDCDCRQHGEQS